MTYKNTNKRDVNEPGLIALWRGAGCVVKQMDKDAGFDLLVIAPNGVHIVEVKNPVYHWKLTEAEQVTRAEVMALGQAYNVIVWKSEALALIGAVDDDAEVHGR